LPLWLALHLPRLSLELFAPSAGPFAVCELIDQRPRIHLCNAAAATQGIRPGQPLTAAIALCPDLGTRNRQPDAESDALTRLALWAQQYTSFVHRLSEGLLLEVAGSLRLFGGIEGLLGRIRTDLATLGYEVMPGLAPTPLGAWLMARNRIAESALDRRELQRLLNRLPLAGLELPAGTVETLHGLGLRRVGDCRRLPRASLARRVGPELLDYLDRALGHRPDPRLPFTPPPRFDGRVLLPAEVDSTPPLLFAARRLVLELVGWLRAQGAGVQAMTFRLEHRGRPASRLQVGLLQPSREPDHLLSLLRERLDRFELPAPTDAVGLSIDRFPAIEQGQGDLFRADAGEVAGPARLLERLRARLGGEAVTGIQPVPDHRPERAWRPCLPGDDDGDRGIPQRPLWLLPEPQPLKEREGRPWFRGGLSLHRGPERIESGWWDGEDAARDYFVAEDREGGRLWVYRERRSGGWFLQGIFG
jgi:protein ImuB